MSQTSSRSIWALAVSFALFSVSTASAANRNWQGPGDLWGTGGNWSGNSVPGSGDSATFSTSAPTTIRINDSFDVGPVSFSSGGAAYTFTDDGSSGRNLNLKSGLTLSNAQTQTFTTSHGSNPLRLKIDGSQTWNVGSGGSVHIFSQLEIGGEWTLNVSHASSSILVNPFAFFGSGKVYIQGAGRVIWSKSYNGELFLQGGTLEIGGSSVAVKNLTVTTSSVLDFGSSPSTFTMTDDALKITSGILTVKNWTEGVDHFMAAAGKHPSTAVLANIHFEGFGAGAMMIGNEIVPIPEPATYGLIFMSLLMGGVGGRRWWNRRKAL